MKADVSYKERALEYIVQQKYLNLACGDFYITNNNWVNLDWYPHSKYVKQTNLLEKLRFKDETFEPTV